MGEIHRTLLFQGPVELTRGTKMSKRHLYLFNDILVVSNNLKKRKVNVKHIIPLNYLCAVDDVDTVNLVRINEISTFKTLALFWPTGNFLATFRSKEQKDHWYYFLKRSTNEAKMGIQKNFSLQIFTEDIPNCDSPLYITATNIDTVNDIIKKLLPMMRMPNSADYQLWFRPGPAEALRPLQGYEYLHEVIMTHLQYTYTRLNSKNSTAFPIFPGLFGKDINLDEEGQFLLKPRYSGISQQQNGKEMLQNKQRPYSSSRFHRGSVPLQQQECTVPTIKKKRLYGKELISITNDGKWPTGILDILSLLREKGPKTQGIFNVAPNETLCKKVKEKLDSGQKMDMTKHSVHVSAWILKEFLQRIKGSLLTSELYERWLDVPQMISDEAKLSAVKSLLEELPTSNAALLGQLFKILNKIARNSSVNHMTSYTLSAVLAPFLLCLPCSRNKVLGNDNARKISLITFLIDNSPELFGLDVVALWYETSFYNPPGANTSTDRMTPSNETEHGVSSCPRARTYTPGHDEVTIIPAAPPLYEGIIESKNLEVNMNETQQATSQSPPVPMKKQVFRSLPPIVCLDKMLPSPILDMLSIIEEKGQESDQIFRYFSEKSHWSLRDKIYTEQPITWKEESVFTVASVLKDLIRNIQGSLLSSEFYENWLSVLDEESLLGKISAIKSILWKIPEANYLLLKHLIRVLLKIKTSAKNHLDTYILSVRIAPHVLWEQTCANSLFGCDLSKKMSVIQIMIDNCVDIFGEDDHNICDDSQKRSDDINTLVNTAAGDNETTSPYDFPQRKLPHD